MFPFHFNHNCNRQRGNRGIGKGELFKWSMYPYNIWIYLKTLKIQASHKHGPNKNEQLSVFPFVAHFLPNSEAFCSSNRNWTLLDFYLLQVSFQNGGQNDDGNTSFIRWCYNQGRWFSGEQLVWG